jgi:hypothetical protein
VRWLHRWVRNSYPRIRGAHLSAHARARQRDHAHDTAGASGTFCAHRQFCSKYFNKIFFQKIVTWVCLCTTRVPGHCKRPTLRFSDQSPPRDSPNIPRTPEMTKIGKAGPLTTRSVYSSSRRSTGSRRFFLQNNFTRATLQRTPKHPKCRNFPTRAIQTPIFRAL